MTLPLNSNFSFISGYVSSFYVLVIPHLNAYNTIENAIKFLQLRGDQAATIICKNYSGRFIMKFVYPAVFKKTEDGRYKGTFPDLEGCFGEGDTLDEAIENANAAAFDWISVELSEEVPELPPITDPDDMELEDEDVVRNIQVTIRLYDGWDE